MSSVYWRMYERLHVMTKEGLTSVLMFHARIQFFQTFANVRITSTFKK